MEAWVCDTCTFLNEVNQNACEVCAGVRRSRPVNVEGMWQCVKCSGSNVRSARLCQACTAPASKRQKIEADAAAETDFQIEAADAIQIDSQLEDPEGQAGASLPDSIPFQSPASLNPGADNGVYILDSCNCRVMQEELVTHLSKQVEQHVLPETSLPTAVTSLCCPKCTACITNKDLYCLLGGQKIAEVYNSIFLKVKALVSPVTAQPKTQCSQCNKPLLSFSCLAPGQAQPKNAVLIKALACRNQPTNGVKAQLAARLKQILGSSCQAFCVSCPEVANTSTSAPASIPTNIAPIVQVSCAAATAVLQHVLQLQQALLGGGSGSSDSVLPRTSRGKSKNGGANKGHHHNSRAWASGTGTHNTADL